MFRKLPFRKVQISRISQAPIVEDFIQKSHDCTIWTKLDLRQGYHQLVLHSESRSIATFSTPWGNFRPKRLVFGAKASQDLFDEAMSRHSSMPQSKRWHFDWSKQLEGAQWNTGAGISESGRLWSHLQRTQVCIRPGTDHLLWLPIWRGRYQTDTGESTRHPWVFSPHIEGRSKAFSRYDWVSLQVYTPVCFTHETIKRVDTQGQ